jgi:uncharacterized protein
MLCFDLRSLEAQAVTVDGLLDASDPVWEPDDVLPLEPGVGLKGRLSPAGRGRFYFSGMLEGRAVTSCRRCLTELTSPLHEEVHFLFAESGLEEADEDDVFPIPPGSYELDLRPALREGWLLAVPQFALCREDCKGLCPTCGADRNTGDCTCAPVADPRWAGLREARGSDA